VEGIVASFGSNLATTTLNAESTPLPTTLSRRLRSTTRSRPGPLKEQVA
jgi:hypothetical protein